MPAATYPSTAPAKLTQIERQTHQITLRLNLLQPQKLRRRNPNTCLIVPHTGSPICLFAPSHKFLYPISPFWLTLPMRINPAPLGPTHTHILFFIVPKSHLITCLEYLLNPFSVPLHNTKLRHIVSQCALPQPLPLPPLLE